jgi:transcriptional regulator with PAS, ATPase and Fis domain
VEHFIPTLSNAMGKRVAKITKSALDALAAYDWPGNVRELKNVLEQAIVISPEESITWDLLPETVRSNGNIPLHLPDKERERYLEFVRTYHDANGNITRVAKLLNVSRPTVYSWCRRFGLN